MTATSYRHPAEHAVKQTHSHTRAARSADMTLTPPAEPLQAYCSGMPQQLIPGKGQGRWPPCTGISLIPLGPQISLCNSITQPGALPLPHGVTDFLGFPPQLPLPGLVTWNPPPDTRHALCHPTCSAARGHHHRHHRHLRKDVASLQTECHQTDLQLCP